MWKDENYWFSVVSDLFNHVHSSAFSEENKSKINFVNTTIDFYYSSPFVKCLRWCNSKYTLHDGDTSVDSTYWHSKSLPTIEIPIQTPTKPFHRHDRCIPKLWWCEFTYVNILIWLRPSKSLADGWSVPIFKMFLYLVFIIKEFYKLYDETYKTFGTNESKNIPKYVLKVSIFV